MNLLSLSQWINFLSSAFLSLQDGLLHGLAALGLTHTSHGQPAWPFSQRLSGTVMLIDHSVARQFLYALACSAAAALAICLALLWRRSRLILLLAAVVLVYVSSWPDRQLLLSTANPTSFHVSPTGFSASAIVHGQQLYLQNCVNCHGVDGKGDTPHGLSLPVMPPNLASTLLWRRADGDLFWQIANGAGDRHGNSSMPSFGTRLSDQDIWALIDFMKANAAGTSIHEIGSWEQPVALPSISNTCGQTAQSSTAAWRGLRVRVILASTNQPQAFPLEDPRLHSVVLSQEAIALPPARAGTPAIDCLIRSSDAWQALSIITGVASDQLAGTQLLTDRDGWLRARRSAREGKSDGWSESDILCRAPTSGKLADGLDGLIAAMDEEPVRFDKTGFVHTNQ